MSKTLTIQEIKKRFNKERPRFICLKNEKGQFVVHWNTPKIKSSDRMKEIEQFFEKESTPDGAYYFYTKESLTKNSPEVESIVVKGNVSPDQLKPKPLEPLSNPMRKDDSVWSVKEAVTHLSENEKLKLQLEAKDQEIERLKKYTKTLEESGPDDDDDDDEESTESLSKTLEKLSEVAAPIIDKFLSLKEKKLNLEERRLNMRHGNSNSSFPDSAGKSIPASHIRADGGVLVDSPFYEEYFQMLYNDDDDTRLNRELDLLEQHEPELYNELVIKYQIEDQPEEDGKGS